MAKDLFGDQLYPTPANVIRQMVDGLDLNHKRILDPSAGRGDILDYVVEKTKYGGYYGGSHCETYAIEIDPDLRQVLTGKGHKVIDSDFLAYTGQMYFDFVLMNPPFKDGAKHLLKAWEVSNGAVIRCLLNAETLHNPHTRDRQILVKLIESCGSIKDLGRPFVKSDNPTDVEIVLVTLQDTRQKETFRLDFDPVRVGQNGFHLGDLEDNQLAPGDIFEGYEARHRAAIDAFKRLLEVRQEVIYYLDGLTGENADRTGIVGRSVEKFSPVESYTDFLDKVTKYAWDNMFRKTKLASVTTEKVRGEIEKMQAAQGTMAFTAANMRDLFDMLFMNREHIMVNCVLEAFDRLTLHHPENRTGVEGWKTNSAYQVGKKFILPNVGSYYGDGLDSGYARDIDDLEKAVCFVSGKKFDTILHVRDVYSHKNNFGQWMISEFFLTQLYRRRTMHFKWRDEELRNDFNALVARHRWGWVPERVKTGVYK